MYISRTFFYETILPFIYLIFAESACLQSYLLADEDIGGVKSNKAKDLGYYLLFFMKQYVAYSF